MERTTANLICRVFLPFAISFYFSYLLRVINALIAPYLIRDLHLGAAELGSMTAMYLFAIAVCALPVGILLDRFGPRRTQAGLLLVATVGSLVFALGRSHSMAMIGRMLIGVGFAGAWMGGIKASVTWFRREQLPLVNGWMMAAGSLGAITASGPADLVVQWAGWRHVFLALAVCSLLVSIVTWLLVPDGEPAQGRALSLRELRNILCDPNFTRIAPLAMCCIGTAWAFQGLWAGRWLADVSGYSQSAISIVLLVMACALGIGGLTLGSIGSGLGRRGVNVETVVGGATFLFMMVEIVILLRIPLPPVMVWGAEGVFGSLNVLVAAIIAGHFPKEKVGRANSLLVIGLMGGAAAAQAGIGGLLTLSGRSAAGHYPPGVYAAAFAVPLALQGLSFAWFVWRRPSSRSAPIRVASATD